MTEYFEEQIRVIDKALHSMDIILFQKLVCDAADVIDKGHKIIVSGLGKNVPICEKFVGSMISMGMEACFLHTNSAIHGDMGIVKDGDLLILLTKSGETGESVCLVDRLMERNIHMWLLIFCQNSTLTRIIPDSIVISLEHEGDMWNIMPNNSTTLNLIILQGLAMQLAKVRNISIQEFKRNHPGGHIGEVLKRD